MQATYNALAADVPLLLFALAAFAIVSVLLAFVFGRIADVLYRRANALTNDGRWHFEAQAARINRLYAVADAFERRSLRAIASAAYWRWHTIRARRRVRRRIGKYTR